jgi:hypothetical protein
MMPDSSMPASAIRLESPVHPLCWIHAERLVHKLDTFIGQHRTAQAQVRGRRRLTALLGISPLRSLI